jgi:NAD(P)H-hydrate epimerase
MPQLILNRTQSRLVDEWAISRYGMSGLVLMENAGRGAVDVLQRVGVRGPVVVCCGPGNNGGDGFVMARHWDDRGTAVRVFLFADPVTLTGDAAANFAILTKAGFPIDVYPDVTLDGTALDDALHGAGCVVDALLGTGSRGEPRRPLDAAIAAINRQPAPVVAVDLPSGLDCDTGAAATHTIRATHTVTFVAAKPGLLMPAAAEYVGKLHVVEIGVPRRLVDEIAAEQSQAEPGNEKN